MVRFKDISVTGTLEKRERTELNENKERRRKKEFRDCRNRVIVQSGERAPICNVP
jgi:hypothetical protein